MKMDVGTPLDVDLHWDADDTQPVGRLACRDRITYLDDRDILQIIERAETAVRKWRDYAADYDVSKASIAEIAAALGDR